MIVCKTVMDRMPERCENCEMGIVCGDEVGCPRTGTMVKRTDPRPPDCPLVEVPINKRCTGKTLHLSSDDIGEIDFMEFKDEYGNIKWEQINPRDWTAIIGSVKEDTP